jgi:hypothetical protein
MGPRQESSTRVNTALDVDTSGTMRTHTKSWHEASFNVFFFIGGRGWVRTSDPCRVKAVLSH